jgi:UDPglucose--hexose-1-phosphate uridylyltransferase
MKRQSVVLEHPHRRLNPLTSEWVLVSPQRTQRPWKGKVESHAVDRIPQFEPDCYLCPGNVRANGDRNPPYEHTFVFDNDFAALTSEGRPFESTRSLFRQTSTSGVCKVICFSPRHDVTLAQMSVAEVRAVIDVWAEQTKTLGQKFAWVQIFENKGEIMGCSNPHPHCQIWASSSIPNEPSKENARQRAYWLKNGKTLLQDYLRSESREAVRLILDNEHWSVVVPFWAVWPFETLLIPKRHVLRLPDLKPVERAALAEILRRFLIRYDNLFEVSFPYTMGLHGAPFGKKDYSHWQFHAHFYPPLLRSSTVKKFMVGYEMLAEPQRDITPEQAAERLKKVSDIHYLNRS